MAIELITRQQPVRSQKLQYGIRVNWGGIFSGAALAVGLNIAFMLFGNAVGFSVQNILVPDLPLGVKIGTWIYTFVGFMISAFSCGFFTVRLCGIDSRRIAAYHGLLAWTFAGTTLMAFGITQSLSFRAIVAGLENPLSNWLLFCAATGGAILSTFGGAKGYVQHEAHLIGGGEGESKVAA